MKFKDWFWIIIPVVASWGFDRLTKWAAESIQGITFYGPVGLVLHHNHGAMLGLFSDLPPVLRIVSLSTGGAFLLFSFVIVQYLLPIRSILLRSGMAFLLGGILGNVTDRIIWGYVVDFLIVGSSTSHTPAFNFADAIQWVGYAMIVFALIKDSELLWPSNNIRRQYWVNPRFQIRYCLILVGVGWGFAMVAGVFAYTYLRVTMIDLIGQNTKIIDQFLIPFLFTYIVLVLGFGAVLFLVGRILSHRTAGPLYAFEKFLEDITAGKSRTLKLRAGDEFRHLEQVADELSAKIAELQVQAGVVSNTEAPENGSAPTGEEAV